MFEKQYLQEYLKFPLSQLLVGLKKATLSTKMCGLLRTLERLREVHRIRNPRLPKAAASKLSKLR